MLKIWPTRIPTIASRCFLAALLLASCCDGQTGAPSAQSPAQALNTQPRIIVPAGTQVTLALTNPVMAKSGAIGSSIYAETVFPVAISNQMAIPAGTYVQGKIDMLKRPGLFTPHAEFQIHFTKIIFANGYTVVLPQTHRITGTQASAQSGSPAIASAGDVLAAVASPYVAVSSRSDVLLDNGAHLDMILQLPLRLNASLVANAVKLTKPGPPQQFRSASMCRPIPGTPGTPDTVIPGTPGTPGTPPTVIPGVNGMPDTVIPGIPPTPGTPDTVIPGTAGTPGVSCPGPPVVVPAKVQNYKETFQIAGPAQVSGKQLPAGTYQIIWKGPGPAVQVDIAQNGNVIANVPARMVVLNAKSPANAPATRSNSDGSASLLSLRFAGQSFALYFEQGPA